MKRTIFLFALFSVSCLFNCGGGTKESHEAVEQKLWDDMMVIHDKVMPSMGDIFKYSKSLQTYLDTTEAVDPGLRTEIEGTIEQLNQADDGMMDWMAALKQPAELKKTKSQQEVIEYLKSESEKIKVVKQKMEESIEAGREMVNKLTPVEVQE